MIVVRSKMTPFSKRPILILISFSSHTQSYLGQPSRLLKNSLFHFILFIYLFIYLFYWCRSFFFRRWHSWLKISESLCRRYISALFNLKEIKKDSQVNR